MFQTAHKVRSQLDLYTFVALSKHSSDKRCATVLVLNSVFIKSSHPELGPPVGKRSLARFLRVALYSPPVSVELTL